MPNWCMNNLKIEGNGEKMLELLEFIKNDNGEMTFEKFMPCPKELEESPAPNNDEDKAKEFEKKYGAADWYHWRLQNWGCKWDASESTFWKDGDDWFVQFQTPWGPPINFFDKLSQQFNKMTFTLQYADESEHDSPLGETMFKNGIYHDVNMDGDENFASCVWDGEWVELG